jgi:hypothetical protein
MGIWHTAADLIFVAKYYIIQRNIMPDINTFEK